MNYGAERREAQVHPDRVGAFRKRVGGYVVTGEGHPPIVAAVPPQSDRLDLALDFTREEEPTGADPPAVSVACLRASSLSV